LVLLNFKQTAITGPLVWENRKLPGAAIDIFHQCKNENGYVGQIPCGQNSLGVKASGTDTRKG
jgi:hypothetical protein